MYYPYLRGKQFELIALRESAQTIAGSGFVPIIEPVKESMNGLQRALAALSEANAKAVVIVNPACGDLVGRSQSIESLLTVEFADYLYFEPGVIIGNDDDLSFLQDFMQRYPARPFAIVHSGYSNAARLSSLIQKHAPSRNVFIERSSPSLYRKHFQGLGDAILIRDGFEQKRNADYSGEDLFSELHLAYRDPLSLDGFGDFLAIGDRYSSGGGPAYAVALHLTYIDERQEDLMFVAHFVSDSNDDPVDPAGKFYEALGKMIVYLDSEENQIPETSAIQEYRRLNSIRHFPGLGYVKKLSINHHIEVMAQYFS